MSDSYISGNEPDKKLQTYENNVGGNDVHSEAVTPTAKDGTPLAGIVTPKSLTTSSSGNNTVVTPSDGNKIRLYWYSLSANPDNSATVTAGLRWTTGGTDFASVPLSQYGGIFAHSPKSGMSFYEGGTNESLELNLSTGQSVTVNIDYEEVA